MTPCVCTRWLFAVRAVSLNGEGITRWGITHRHAIDRYMSVWTEYQDHQWQERAGIR